LINNSQSGGELASIHIANFLEGSEKNPFPSYASHFSPSRYDDDNFLVKSKELNSKSGQL